MSNNAFIKGFEPVRVPGKEFDINQYILKTGQKVYRGDPVKRDSSGTVTPVTASSDAFIGVAMENVDDSASVGNQTLGVCDDPDAIYAVNARSASGTTTNDLVAADVWLNAGMTTLGSTDTLNLNSSGLSCWYLDVDTKATTQALPWRIVGIIDTPDNAWGANMKVKVKPNIGVPSASTAGVTGV